MLALLLLNNTRIGRMSLLSLPNSQFIVHFVILALPPIELSVWFFCTNICCDQMRLLCFSFSIGDWSDKENKHIFRDVHMYSRLMYM